jgi:hypothetical protein
MWSLCAALLMVSNAFGAAQPAAAAAPAVANTTISGTITDGSSGLPVAAATVVLVRGTENVATTVTDQAGRYRFANEGPGIYHLTISRSGSDTSTSGDIAVTPEETMLVVDVTVNGTTAGTRTSQTLKTIGQVTASARSGLQKSSTVSRDVSPQELYRENWSNVADGIGQLPGVNIAGHSSSIGDDESFSLRGFSPSESETLLDGHPIGPIGTGGATYNFSASPFLVLKNVQVTFGAGALGLYGTDATGGTVDLQTIDPTYRPQFQFTQGIGSQGKLTTAAQATGTIGRLGYAFAGGVQGTYGDFRPGIITQTGLLGSDISPGNIAANTYSVSGAYTLRNALGKLVYTIAPGTVASFTVYNASSRDDKSGVGDNDFEPSGDIFNNQAVDGPTGMCPGQVELTVDNAGTVKCFSPQQAAQLTSGPAGGGPDPFQTITDQDYHGRLVTNVLGQTIAVDGYINTYNLNYNRNHASQNAAGIFTGGFREELYKTNGFTISDDIVHGNNDFGFGYSTQHQVFTGNDFDTGTLQIVQRPERPLGTDNIYLRDTFTPAPFATIYTNLYYKLLSTTGGDTVDPRVTLQLRPTNNDVVRIIAGKTDGEPAAALASNNFNQTPSNLNPQSRCKTFVGYTGADPNAVSTRPLNVGTLGATNLNQETATDYQLTFGHSFSDGSTVQIGGYVDHTSNLLASTTVPVPTGVVPAALLQAYYARIRQFCGSTYVGSINDLAFTQAYNGTTSGLFRGIELTGRVYANRNVFFDFTYDLQHAQTFGYTDAQLQSNPTAINGGQVNGIPLTKGSLGIEYDDKRGFNARVDAYYFGNNNAYNRPSYTFENASLAYDFKKTGTSLIFGVNNVGNTAYQQYGYINAGLPVPVNQYGGPGDALTEEFGLTPRTFLFSLSQKVGF